MRLLQIPLTVQTVTTVRLNWQTNYLCRFCWCAEDGSDVKVSLVSSWSWRKLDTVFNGQVRPGRRDKYHLGEEKLFNTIKVSSFFIVYFRTLQVDKNFGWFATKTCFDIVSFMFLRLSRLFIFHTYSRKNLLLFFPNFLKTLKIGLKEQWYLTEIFRENRRIGNLEAYIRSVWIS